MALVQSVESSNRIEGVTVDPARLRPLVLGNARPRDRHVEEEKGRYYDVLETSSAAWHEGRHDFENGPSVNR